MDGVHDLGGKEGFGPVDRAHEDDPYHGDHDARAYGLSVSLRLERPYPVDWFRHVRELVDPVDYLTRPYFDSWLQTCVALAIDAGALELAEVTGHKAPGPAPADANPLTAEGVRDMLYVPPNFERPIDTPPAFTKGGKVRTAAHGHSGHTRLPAYARNAVGTIYAHHGAHPLPDAEARGEKIVQHLYTVGFRAADLFPEVTNDDEIYLDLWESYLVGA